MNTKEIFDRDKIVLDGLEDIARRYVTDEAVNAANNAAEAYSRRHMLGLVQTGKGDPDTLRHERMRYAVAAGMLLCATGLNGGESDG
ncbi:hypothetical protein [Brucella anthropi]|uniref:hypothetical protein n=1 Tax=Brucella anthropi TaxID=529 RepID=UPI000F67CC3D|nr:hypothetical protein [Brucella anthropi]RRY08835.1 hypothetical protein EGJ58_13120 [Brucella anthropi]